MKALKGKKSWTILTASVLILGLNASQAWAGDRPPTPTSMTGSTAMAVDRRTWGRCTAVSPPISLTTVRPVSALPLLPDPRRLPQGLGGRGARTEQRGAGLCLWLCQPQRPWGADVTAHHNDLTLGQGEGYVIVKAKAMKTYLSDTLAYMGIRLDDKVAMDLSHNFVEYGVDMLVKRLDGQVGAKMADAASKPGIPASRPCWCRPTGTMWPPT